MKPYNKYQLQWMINHEHTIADLVAELEEMRQMYEAEGEYFTIQDLFDEWEFNAGFNGELWACYGEWEAMEGKV